MNRKLKLRADSKYVLTDLLQDGDDTFFGVWTPPEIPLTIFDSFYTIKPQDVGRLDALANKYYGNTELWWVIAQANQINDAFAITPGTILRIPLKTSVTAALNL